ncbi:uncharacterized protein LOC106057593 [Biomphalaria glabrata]|uniref:Uncharacterized protein LOC106057593 n=1 Tax=Biomphalaria glabrata TaxID=6526 RepID=A0A9W3APL7_BIOGL|nr:uncharacterized protein LOC106057593 [Biomphalaria glabrata]XP_055889217.1 uncharacterized protein LOC106057593 [Biomphalaria glabrata]
MSEVWNEEVKNIGDAGDSTRGEVDDDLSNPVTEIVSCIKRVLQCGDHQGLKIHLGRLQEWRRCGQTNLIHDYWRVAQYIGESELNNICLLLSITFDKPEGIRWCYMADVLSLLATALCNREAIFRLMAHTNNIIPILVEAAQQVTHDDVKLYALTIINVTVLVCRARFAKHLVSSHFLNKIVDHWTCQGEKIPSILLEKTLNVVKSLLMCGQIGIHNYATAILTKMSNVMQCQSGQRQLFAFYQELVRSTDLGEKPHICARYWTRGRLRKELLGKCLGQPWLYIYCSWPACGNHNATPNTFFRKCSACSAVRYCSRQCQEKHWRAGHNGQCKLISCLAQH